MATPKHNLDYPGPSPSYADMLDSIRYTQSATGGVPQGLMPASMLNQPTTYDKTNREIPVSAAFEIVKEAATFTTTFRASVTSNLGRTLRASWAVDERALHASRAAEVASEELGKTLVIGAIAWSERCGRPLMKEGLPPGMAHDVFNYAVASASLPVNPFDFDVRPGEIDLTDYLAPCGWEKGLRAEPGTLWARHAPLIDRKVPQTNPVFSVDDELRAWRVEAVATPDPYAAKSLSSLGGLELERAWARHTSRLGSRAARDFDDLTIGIYKNGLPSGARRDLVEAVKQLRGESEAPIYTCDALATVIRRVVGLYKDYEGKARVVFRSVLLLNGEQILPEPGEGLGEATCSALAFSRWLRGRSFDDVDMNGESFDTEVPCLGPAWQTGDT